MKPAIVRVQRLSKTLQAYNIVAAVDNSNSRGILDQTRNDGKALSDTVSIMTLLFLPGTFISVRTNILNPKPDDALSSLQGFFGMNFFKLADSGSWSVSTDVYIFFACAGPVTLIGFILFILELNIIPWTRRHISRPFKRWVLRQRHYLITSGDAPMKDGGQKDSV